MGGEGLAGSLEAIVRARMALGRRRRERVRRVGLWLCRWACGLERPGALRSAGVYAGLLVALASVGLGGGLGLVAIALTRWAIPRLIARMVRAEDL